MAATDPTTRRSCARRLGKSSKVTGKLIKRQRLACRRLFPYANRAALVTNREPNAAQTKAQNNRKDRRASREKQPFAARRPSLFRSTACQIETMTFNMTGMLKRRAGRTPSQSFSSGHPPRAPSVRKIFHRSHEL